MALTFSNAEREHQVQVQISVTSLLPKMSLFTQQEPHESVRGFPFLFLEIWTKGGFIFECLANFK